MSSEAKKTAVPSSKKGRARRPGPIVGVVRLLAMAATVTALVAELRKPRGERTWHGKVWGFIPYDMRLPTQQRVKERMWAPTDPSLVVPTVFGVGWTVNLGRVIALLRRRTSTTTEAAGN
jgi:hypothetical protein